MGFNIKTSTMDSFLEIDITLSQYQISVLCKTLKQSVYLDSNSSDFHTTKDAFDIFSGEPIQTLSITKTKLKSELCKIKHFYQSIFDDIKLTHTETKVPFTHGLLGYLSYTAGEIAQLKENHTTSNYAPEDFPDVIIGFYTWSYVYCHARKKGLITFSPYCSQSTRKKILDCIKIAEAQSIKPNEESINYLSTLTWKKSQTFDEYSTSFHQIKNYINEGDCYQVNLTQRFEASSSQNAVDLYFQTRQQIQTPYSCLFSFSKSQHLLSFSPEQFISINNGVIESRPIKGTIRNNGTNENKQRLLDSKKNRAENVMIVDLLRNDLGKVCENHSVEVAELFKIETYKNVHHLVSHIKGQLKKDMNEMDAFLSCFPGGSITGAPKIRAMEIIRELEFHSRKAYCGSVFYLNADGRFDSNILIRTIIKNHDDLYCWAGGGIVSDSELRDEYQESLSKVSNITGIES